MSRQPEEAGEVVGDVLHRPPRRGEGAGEVQEGVGGVVVLQVGGGDPVVFETPRVSAGVVTEGVQAGAEE
jgi:hypothetical protein